MKSSKEMADSVFMIRDEYLEKKHERNMAVRKAAFTASPICAVALIIAGAVFFGNKQVDLPPVTYPSETITDSDTDTITENNTDTLYDIYSDSDNMTDTDTVSHSSSGSDDSSRNGESRSSSSKQNTSSKGASSKQSSSSSGRESTSANTDRENGHDTSSDRDSSSNTNSRDTTTSRNTSSRDTTTSRNTSSRDTTTSRNSSDMESSYSSNPYSSSYSSHPDSDNTTDTGADSDYSSDSEAETTGESTDGYTDTEMSTDGSTDTEMSTDGSTDTAAEPKSPGSELEYWTDEMFYEAFPEVYFDNRKYVCSNRMLSPSDIGYWQANTDIERFSIDDSGAPVPSGEYNRVMIFDINGVRTDEKIVVCFYTGIYSSKWIVYSAFDEN